MTRRRDLIRHVLGFIFSYLLFVVIMKYVIDFPFTASDWKVIMICAGIQSVMLAIASFYVWRANITKTKEMPEYLIDFPDSMVYLLSLPTFGIFLKMAPFYETTQPFIHHVFLFIAFLSLVAGLIFIVPILVEGIGLFLSSKYSQIKKHKENKKEVD